MVTGSGGVRDSPCPGTPQLESKIKPTLVRSVQKFVKHTKKKTLADLCHVIEINDTYAAIVKLGDTLWFGDVLRKHNDDAEDITSPIPMLLSA